MDKASRTMDWFLVNISATAKVVIKAIDPKMEPKTNRSVNRFLVAIFYVDLPTFFEVPHKYEVTFGLICFFG